MSTLLERGHRVGIVASTANHSGNAGYAVGRRDVTRGKDGALVSRLGPAERGTALLAVHAEDVTREGIFRGIYHRRTNATTGERIALWLEVGSEPMGGEIRAAGAVGVDAEIPRRAWEQ